MKTPSKMWAMLLCATISATAIAADSVTRDLTDNLAPQPNARIYYANDTVLNPEIVPTFIVHQILDGQATVGISGEQGQALLLYVEADSALGTGIFGGQMVTRCLIEELQSSQVVTITAPAFAADVWVSVFNYDHSPSQCGDVPVEENDHLRYIKQQ